MQVDGGMPEQNRQRAERYIAEAAAQGADLALLPECLNVGWTHPASLTHAEAIPAGATFQALAASARLHGIYVCAGLVERDGEAVFNSAVLIDRQGELLLRHRKINELDIGHPYYAQGQQLRVCTTEFGTIGVMICADGLAEDQVIARSLGYMGADMILSPCAWAVPADHNQQETPYGALWQAAYGPVAKAFAIWILGVSNVGWISAGPWAGQQCIGCSLVVDPAGAPVVQGPYGVDAEALVVVEVTPVARPVRGTGWQTRWARATP
jgi:predicted amidohydrolase